jgi:hypothetical protein
MEIEQPNSDDEVPIEVSVLASLFQIDREHHRRLEEGGERPSVPSFSGKVLGDKTTHLLVFGLMLAKGMEQARHYADSARRAGASWKELYVVAELVSAISALQPRGQNAALFGKTPSGDQSSDNR